MTALDLIYEALKDKWFASKASKYCYDGSYNPEKQRIYQRVEMESEKSLRWTLIVIDKHNGKVEVDRSYEDFTSDESADFLREIKSDRLIRKLTALEAKNELLEEDEDEDDDDYY